jgi:hypothetical protein
MSARRRRPAGDPISGQGRKVLGQAVLGRWCGFAGVVIAVVGLAGCDPARNPAWELAGHPGLLQAIGVYYERNAWEENGRCTAPLLEGVTRAEVLAEDEDQLVIRVRYRYRDSIRDRPRVRSGAAGLFRECAGFAVRTFTIAKEPEGLVVVGMDGPQRPLATPTG